MTLDHIAAAWGLCGLWRVPGRLAAPLFVWGCLLGASMTASRLRYALRLFAVAVVAEYFHFRLGFWVNGLNICFALAWLVFTEHLWFRGQWVAATICCGLLAVAPVEFALPIAFVGLASGLAGGGVVDWRPSLHWLCGGVWFYVTVLRWGWCIDALGGCAFFVVPWLRRGPYLPVVFRYAFYPCHLAVILVAKKMLSGA